MAEGEFYGKESKPPQRGRGRPQTNYRGRKRRYKDLIERCPECDKELHWQESVEDVIPGRMVHPECRADYIADEVSAARRAAEDFLKKLDDEDLENPR